MLEVVDHLCVVTPSHELLDTQSLEAMDSPLWALRREQRIDVSDLHRRQDQLHVTHNIHWGLALLVPRCHQGAVLQQPCHDLISLHERGPVQWRPPFPILGIDASANRHQKRD